MMNGELYNQNSSMQLQGLIEKFVNENAIEYSSLFEPMKKAANLKYKEYIKETVIENAKRGNYIRIYPSRGCEMYDAFFTHARPYNKVINKVLFSDEVVKNYGKLACFSHQNSILPEKQLGYDMKMPPQTYEQYKKINQER